MKIDKKLIKELESYLTEFNLSEIEYGDSNTKIKVARNFNKNQTSSFEEVAKEKKEIGFTISSPMVGTTYLAPEPGGKKFIEVGQRIKKGQTVIIIEAMKTMNHVPSTKDGVVKKILVEDGQPVEFGQGLILLD